MNYQKQIQNHIKWKSKNLNPEQLAVLNYIINEGYKKNKKVSQKDIAKSERWLGTHDKFEDHLKGKKLSTTKRKVREVIRQLRVKHKIPILSGSQGYWIPKERHEAQEFINRLENQVKSNIKSSYYTYSSLSEALGIESEVMEQISMFNQ